MVATGDRACGRLTSLGPPEAAGRWSLVEPAAATPTARLHAQSLALLERHGVLTREAVASEGIDGGFSAVYPVLRAMEEAGRIRRGYFVDGLGAAQFALAGALDRLRAVARLGRRPGAEADAYLLAATDPANPFGAALPWPRRDEARSPAAPACRRAPTSRSWMGRRRSTWSEAGPRSRPSPRPTTRRDGDRASGRSPGSLVDGRARELVIRKVDGLPSRIRRGARHCWPPASLPATAGWSFAAPGDRRVRGRVLL